MRIRIEYIYDCSFGLLQAEISTSPRRTRSSNFNDNGTQLCISKAPNEPNPRRCVSVKFIEKCEQMKCEGQGKSVGFHFSTKFHSRSFFIDFIRWAQPFLLCQRNVTAHSQNNYLNRCLGEQCSVENGLEEWKNTVKRCVYLLCPRARVCVCLSTTKTMIIIIVICIKQNWLIAVCLFISCKINFANQSNNMWIVNVCLLGKVAWRRDANCRFLRAHRTAHAAHSECRMSRSNHSKSMALPVWLPSIVAPATYIGMVPHSFIVIQRFCFRAKSIGVGSHGPIIIIPNAILFILFVFEFMTVTLARPVAQINTKLCVSKQWKMHVINV